MEIQFKNVFFPSNGGTTPGYLARPSDNERHRGLVIIQEWWGLVPHIKAVADRFAHEGFITLAPDLYHGQQAEEPDEARKLAMELDRDRAVDEIAAAMAYLRTMGAVSPKKIGVVGWCMGGSLTLATAAQVEEVGAAVVFYGHPRDLEIVNQIQAPIIGFYGEQDRGIPVDTVREIERMLKESGTPHQFHIYAEAGHAFFNDARPSAFNAKAAEDAWSRTLNWLREHLQ